MARSLKNFLEKYSVVPSKFLDQYFEMQNLKSENEEFNIDLDIVASWLDALKASLKETLINSYSEGIDYIIEVPRTGKVGKPLEKIYLSRDCFKIMCFLSKTKKADEVRNYFIQIEKLLDKYKDHIIRGLTKRIKILENNQK